MATLREAAPLPEAQPGGRVLGTEMPALSLASCWVRQEAEIPLDKALAPEPMNMSVAVNSNNKMLMSSTESSVGSSHL